MASPLPSIKLLPFGAIIQAITINGKNIVQGFPTTDDYVEHNSAHFGATIGRVANRLKDAKIDNLNGKSYSLNANNGPCSLHGGPTGWGKRTWQEESVKRDGKDAVLYTYVSEDGEEGFPGRVKASVWYTPYEEKGEEGETVTVLDIEYEAELVGDEVEETVINMTNHSYFNLAGDDGPTIEGTDISLSTTSFLEVDQYGIPTGPIKPYPSLSPNTSFTLGAQEPDVDDCFAFDTNPKVPIDTRSLPLRVLVKGHHPSTNINLQVSATEPAFQFYTGKYIDTPELRNGEWKKRGARSGFCVEPSRFVNAVNVPEWRDQMVLKKGEKYGMKTKYRVWVGEKGF